MTNKLPQPAEVGLDLHMLRHEVLEAAKALYQHLGEPLALQPQKKMLTLYGAVERLIAGEEEHAKIVAANQPVASNYKECRHANVEQDYGQMPGTSRCRDCGRYNPENPERDERLASPTTKAEYDAKWERRERSATEMGAERLYAEKRCAEIAARLRDDTAMLKAGVVTTDAKLLWDAAYWLDRMANTDHTVAVHPDVLRGHTIRIRDEERNPYPNEAIENRIGLLRSMEYTPEEAKRLCEVVMSMARR